MASRFVSGGVIDSSGDAVLEGATKQTSQQDGGAEGNSSNSAVVKEPPRNAEWEAVQKELEAQRKRRDEQRIKAASGEVRSLYEVLQANKEAKQAAFDEQNKIRNQFRALDDDEVDFLEEVRERERKAEEEKRRELEAGLKAFREARRTEGKVDGDGEGEDGGESWEVGGRKRKRIKGKDGVKGVVRRKVGSGDGEKGEEVKEEKKMTEEAMKASTTAATKATSGSTSGSKGLSLVGYGSDDSDDV